MDGDLIVHSPLFASIFLVYLNAGKESRGLEAGSAKLEARDLK